VSDSTHLAKSAALNQLLLGVGKYQAKKPSDSSLSLGKVLAGFALLLLVVLTGAFWVAGGYLHFLYAETEIDQARLADRGSRSSFVYDRAGNLLYELYRDRRQHHAGLDNVAPVAIDAVLAAEDKRFFEHSGVDLLAIVRSTQINLGAEEIRTGASTITQQVVKYLYHTDQGSIRAEESLDRKLHEALQALKLEQTQSKESILEFYLNNVFFGNGAWGIETAAQAYFGKSAAALTLAESSLLAGVISQPSRANPLLDPGVFEESGYTFSPEQTLPDELPIAKQRQHYVLVQMLQAGMITEEEAAEALNQPLEFADQRHPLVAGHFVWYVEQYLIETLGPERLAEGGLHIHTTLNPNLQRLGERLVSDHLRRFGARSNMGNGALLALDPRNGEILAMVGSRSYFDDAIQGKVNVITSSRQSGSAIKPLLYAYGFEQGMTPDTRIADTYIRYPDGYTPRNADRRYHGILTLRQALANSYNVPAVKLVDHLGLNNTVEFVQTLGLTSLKSANHYGLSFALGTAEISPLELATGYAVIANQGKAVRPHPIKQLIDDAQVEIPIFPIEPVQLISPQSADYVTSILSDRRARSWTFGWQNALNLTRPAAVKTGTTSSFRDNWTAGYTPDLLTVVWTGNTDGTPLINSYGSQGAAPLWQNFMEAAFVELEIE